MFVWVKLREYCLSRTMQGSTRIKSHQRPGKPHARKDRGKHKPVAQRQARARRQALKQRLGV